jgi:cytochrome c5
MRITLTTTIMGLALVACAHSGNDGAVDTPSDASISGETAYLEHCAGCHETGMLGAPREGEPADWESRSKLWQGVLMEHAKTGYFDMPARGGKAHLPDEVVDAAAEYMLEKTFPNRPRD